MTEMIKERNQNAYDQHRSGGRIAAAMMVALVDSLAGGKQFAAIAVGPKILCFGLPEESEKK